MHATNFWSEHLRGTGDNPKLLDLATRLLTDPSSDLMEWTWVCFVLPSSVRTEQLSGSLSNSEVGQRKLLYIATLIGSSSLIHRMVERGADISETGGDCGTPLAAAIMNADPKTVKHLFERGADVNVQGGMFSNALQIACAFGNVKSVELLLEHRADPNTYGGEFRRLYSAANYEGLRPEKTVKLLLESGADPILAKHPSATPLCAAVITRDEATRKILLDAAASVDDNSLIVALLWGHLHMANILTQEGTCLEQANHHIGHPLNAAVIGGVGALKFLMEVWHVDPHMADNEGRTALHVEVYSRKSVSSGSRTPDQ
ncbi:ankyrin [Macroventuria anomochaeta]|uniref:Ankyrin n=1 Tax=Macroventuria anomochaeta TaxID=301207 RepID=A0ACB6S9W3_9PLEO|nr:ankyrin [Macroventuria anomochaeta]KAF2630009.1 ankyrin [Macroventuria anomochaeta]